ncbi:DHA2 family efflux MFS transporter permease subunit [Paenibacillus macerans]|uniref:DHA2 family efflux MFS transporter permease subunit n=1 Tax=Paenibacillus macerans TaxID=44252 RepID=A0A6N8F1V7_PAEMA|nr:DHA2 family efflux MFS transporter permease subunit [Paenibacillus macerans]MED4954477.1 DHA2 family efflux MFS transporter permease subunit [Paenibacillus macerans]MUG24883.1 DHA2 family efflux MFS transporter permease subunit [Paenibacillus macerans]
MGKEQSLPTFKRNVLVVVMLAGAFVTMLNQTLLNTALPQIMKDLSISANTAQWLTTGFMLVTGVLIPVSAFLIEKFSTRRLFITAMCLFASGTLMAAIAPNFPVLLFGRILQAVSDGLMLPLMQTIFLMIFPVKQRGSAMGMVGLVMAFAPAIGPTLSGWVVGNFSWRALFYMIFPIAVLIIIFASFMLENVTKVTRPKIDIMSIILSSLGFGGLLYGFSSAGNHAWNSSEVVIALITGTVAIGLFIWRQLAVEKPMLEFRVLKNWTFSLTLFIGMVVMVTMIGVELFLPLYIQTARGFTPLESGLLLLPGAIVMGIMSPITGRIFDKIGARPLALIGSVILVGMTFLFSNMTASTPYIYMMVIYAIRMFGISLMMMPVMTAGLNQLPDHLIPHGTAMSNTLTQMAASVGAALLVTVMTNNTAAAVQQKLPNPMIHGVSVAFTFSTVLAFFALVLSFFIKPMKISQKEDTQDEGSSATES